MISLFKENQFELKMMELKDTFGWEILHHSIALSAGVRLSCHEIFLRHAFSPS